MSEPELPVVLPRDGERMVPEYDHDDAVYSAHIGRYLLAQRFAPQARVLDVASGAGYGAAMLASAGAASVVGLDRSAAAVLYSRENYGGSGVAYVVGDAQRLPFGAGAFDVVVSFETIEHLPDTEAFLDEVRRVLRPGGVLVISTPNVDVYPEGNPHHLHEFHVHEFEAALRTRFREVVLLGQDRWIADAVFPEALLERGDLTTVEPLPTTKIVGRTLAEQQFLVAVCSDAAVPEQGPHVVIGTTSDAEYVRTELARRDVVIDRLTFERDRHEAAAREALEGRAALQEQIRERDRRIEAKEMEIRALEARLDGDGPLEEGFAPWDEDDLRAAQAELDAMRGSLAWKVVERYRRSLARLAPPDSGRRRAYALALRAARDVRSLRALRASAAPAPAPAAPAPAIGFAEEPNPRVSVIVPVHNGADITRRCLEALVCQSLGTPYEVIVVDDASTDGTAAMLAATANVRVVRNGESSGYLVACNQGAAQARGEHLVFLNNDTEVQHGWLPALLSVVDRDETVGLVGAKLLYPDGRLQEAGSIVWDDGTGWNYGRGQDPEDPAYNYMRDVDYCSAACILVRRALFEQVGGFDVRFRPAYYEDVDLAFAVRACGWRVVFQPACRVVHLEGASHGTDPNAGIKRFQEVNRGKLVEKWGTVLAAEHHPPGSDLFVARDRRRLRRALVVDETVPAYDRDAGSSRMDHLLRLLGELGWLVTFVPSNQYADQPYTRELQDRGIEVLCEVDDVDDRLRLRGPSIELCILSRPQVAWRHLHTLREVAPGAKVLYDTVDLHYVREGRRAAVEGAVNVARVAAAYRELELGLVRTCDATITVSAEERMLLEREVPGARVVELPTVHPVREPATPFADRDGIVFVGNYHHLPNVDAVRYFVHEVLPLVRARAPEIVFHIVGSAPSEAVRALARPGVVVTGWVPDLDAYLERRRVFVAPLRYGAGMKGKIGESMALGVPVVTTSVGAEGLNLADGREALVADDPPAFAAAILRVWRDQVLWESLSRNGLAHIDRTLSPEVVKSMLSKVLAELGVLATENNGAVHLDEEQATV